MLNEKELKRVEQLKRMERYLFSALDTLQANECFSSDKAMIKHLGIEEQDLNYLDLKK